MVASFDPDLVFDYRARRPTLDIRDGRPAYGMAAAARGYQHPLGEWNFHVEAWSVALGLMLSLGTGIVFISPNFGLNSLAQRYVIPVVAANAGTSVVVDRISASLLGPRVRVRGL